MAAAAAKPTPMSWTGEAAAPKTAPTATGMASDPAPLSAVTRPMLPIDMPR